MWILALSFIIGMFTLNLAIGVMHVSLAMTLRAVEPLFTLALGKMRRWLEPHSDQLV